MDKLSSEALLKAQADYWSQQTDDVDGMLGGYGHVAEVDVESSIKFLRTLISRDVANAGRALDCGAGIGRITKDMLLPFGFNKVDLLDINAGFLAKARTNLVDTGRVGECYCSGLAEFDFATAQSVRWTTIWVQWCAIYLTDKAFVDFFNRAADALDDGGVVVLKQNVLKGMHRGSKTPMTSKHVRINATQILCNSTV
eukprot:TRINITY_DN12474_c0_g7_i2.p2 TRINITY_DN12474_c0_g7~~TRINITY_DN12474_c0_g7_i2.p2  ORF type:complete len:198 (+),score=55.76 TRINITY_DN12474_c0_g7_i2:210-803(+)